ncbi:uroplakin-3b [Pluvialis apricaria]
MQGTILHPSWLPSAAGFGDKTLKHPAKPGCCKDGSSLGAAALLPYVPCVPPTALPGKLTATTFALERPCCVFDRHANASDTVWLVVAFANASATFRNPLSRADVPLYEQLPTAHSYMTLETMAATYACSAPSPAVLRVGGDTACGGQGGQDPCNGPLPSPGPYRVKFLVMGCRGPKAETRWSDPILLRRGTSDLRGSPPPARHQPYAITPKSGGEKQSPLSPSPIPPLSIAPPLSPPCPPPTSLIPPPSSRQPEHHRPRGTPWQ